MKLRLFCGVCLVISQFSYGQIHFSSEDVFPHKKEIYKKGWIDFNKNGIKDVYEDSKQSVESRLDDLLSQMTLEEKAGQLVTYYGYKKCWRTAFRRGMEKEMFFVMAWQILTNT